ncbi:hypothetical protein JX266_010672 [Neoarthrinium moseri]|nr:hypothetical protein JX266_010672 [Neoarthrinium moseri]
MSQEKGGPPVSTGEQANLAVDTQQTRDRARTDAEVPDALPSPPGIAALQDDRRTQSAPDAINAAAAVHSSPTSPLASQPALGHPRTSLNMQRATNTKPRNVRASEEFDRRYDGPFGRPSLVMARRRSSQQPGLPEEDATENAVQLTTVEPMPDGGEQLHVQLYEPEPPKLNYTLRTRKMAIFIFWFVVVFDSTVMPIGLYFGLWYGVGPGNPANEKLSANTVFSIVTAALGGVSILEYFVRFWRLWKKDSTCRVIGARRWYLDWFHWMFTLAWLIVMVELIVGSVPEDPYIRLLAMPLATMLFVFGTLLLTIDGCRYFHVTAPCRISSIPKGAQLRPGIYSLIEDVCAVDGSGGTDFRVAFDRRYEASHVFRSMLRRLGIFWAFGAQGCAILNTALIFGLNNADAAYTIGWSVPFIWAGIWTLATFWYAKRELKKEKKLWAAEAAKNRA